jgi:hypothetical protein
LITAIVLGPENGTGLTTGDESTNGVTLVIFSWCTLVAVPPAPCTVIIAVAIPCGSLRVATWTGAFELVPGNAGNPATPLADKDR